MDLDDVGCLKTLTTAAMKKKGLIWDQRPSWVNASSSVGAVRIIQGRMSDSSDTEFIGPFTTELAFYSYARHVASDWK